MADDVLERALTRKLYRVECPDPHVLGEYHLGLLGDRPEVAAHVQDCRLCQEELVALKRFLGVREIPPARVLLAQWLPSLRVAEPAPAFALRGEPRMTSATYRAEEFTVTVSVHEDPKGPDVRIVSGVVTPVDVSHGGWALLSGPAHTAEVPVDAAGQFAFGGVPVGRYTLELQLGEATVQVSPLEVA
jgi:hypothetical protein